MKYGFYSEKAAQRHGSSFFYTGNGGMVEVTTVSSNIDGDANYKWDDTKYVGPVTSWAKDGKKGTFQIYTFTTQFEQL